MHLDVDAELIGRAPQRRRDEGTCCRLHVCEGPYTCACGHIARFNDPPATFLVDLKLI